MPCGLALSPGEAEDPAPEYPHSSGGSEGGGGVAGLRSWPWRRTVVGGAGVSMGAGKCTAVSRGLSRESGCMTRTQTRSVVTAQAGEHSPGLLEVLPCTRPHARVLQ